jgi:parvulin-like peptidyl-prolyl isomerase
MRNKIIAGILLAAVVQSAVVSAALNEGGDKIVAIVNDEIITLKDLKAYMASIYSQLRIENSDPFEIDQIMRQYEQKGINQLIEDKLILAAAKEKDMLIKQVAVDKKIDEIKSRYPSELVFQTMIEQQGMTITDVRDRITDQMKAKFMVDTEVRSKIFVNPQEVTDYYSQHQNDFIQKARVNLDSIFLSFDKGLDAARKEAAEVHEQLKDGKDFSELAKAHSDLPSVGVMEEGQLKPDLELKVFNMKEDELSEPIEVENGIYIFKFLRKSDRETKPLKDVKESIYNEIFAKKFQDRFQDWIQKLRKKAYVDIRG